ncbi:hypothetical protein F5Y16DRAFT_138143 [Xylariaceae sp. FL0255]|nr:hypothetical protein F5Y16DRAFT_138143 [Xylariaceae sp. FL0255]
MSDSQDHVDQPEPSSDGELIAHSNTSDDELRSSTPIECQGVSTFHRFSDLPAELRARIWELALTNERTIRTVAVRPDDSTLVGGPLVLLTQRADLDTLFKTAFEARREVSFRGFELPVRWIHEVGNEIVELFLPRHIEGLRFTFQGIRALGRDTTTFFMSQETAEDVFLSPISGVPAPLLRGVQLANVRNIMLDWRTFQHLLSGHHGFASPDELFTRAIPGLKRIVVGFLVWFRNVVIVEGLYEEVVAEVAVTRRENVSEEEGDDENSVANRGIEEVWDVSCAVRLDRGIEHMIRQTVSQTVNEVRALNEAGVEVVWVVVREGFVRREERMILFNTILEEGS